MALGVQNSEILFKSFDEKVVISEPVRVLPVIMEIRLEPSQCCTLQVRDLYRILTLGGGVSMGPEVTKSYKFLKKSTLYNVIVIIYIR